VPLQSLLMGEIHLAISWDIVSPSLLAFSDAA
jgi:hypothetical protein